MDKEISEVIQCFRDKGFSDECILESTKNVLGIKED